MLYLIFNYLKFSGVMKIRICFSVFQPAHDLSHLLEGLNEYKGLLSTFPDILLVYRVRILLFIIGSCSD